MTPITSFAGKRVALFGLGGSGLVSASALLAGGADVVAFDDDAPTVERAAAAGIPTADLRTVDWSRIAAIVLTPGVPLTHPVPHWAAVLARSAGVEIIGDVELFDRERAARAPAAPFVAITGTNGKSTTTALIGHILQSLGFDAQVGGNIGKPVLDLGAPWAKTVYVLEVSSYQVDLSPNLVPDVALLTNLSPDHIDRHGSMANYAAVKESLLARTASDGHMAIGIDDPHSAAIYTRLASARGSNAVAVSVGKVLGRGVFVIDGKLYDSWDQPATQMGDLALATRIPGAHNWQNAGLAYAAVKRLVADPRAIVPAIARFPGLAHRIEEVGRLGKVRFINDSKATNADAAARALACFPDIFWIAGGKPKEGGIAELEPYFPRMRRAYLIGEAARAFGRTLEGKVDAMQAGTLDRALSAAYDDARMSGCAEPVVLLSPACASFDQFRDYEQRGDAFRELVRSLVEAEAPAQKTGARS